MSIQCNNVPSHFIFEGESIGPGQVFGGILMIWICVKSSTSNYEKNDAHE